MIALTYKLMWVRFAKESDGVGVSTNKIGYRIDRVPAPPQAIICFPVVSFIL